MKIALAQLNYTIGDIEGNTLKIIDTINRAKDDGADLVLFAEQAISGTPAFDLLRKTTFLELCEEALVEIASVCDGITAIVGLPTLSNDGTISTAAIIQDRKILHYVGKKYIGARRDMGFLTSGRGVEYGKLCGEKIGLILGDDIRRVKTFDKTVDTIINLTSRRYFKGVISSRCDFFSKLAFRESKNIIFINQVGGASDIVYDGTSTVYGKNGDMHLMMKSFEEDYALFDTNREYAPIKNPYTTYNDRARLMYRGACLGLHDYFHKNGYQKACLGLSGGIDSAVVACIAVEALGRENVKALIMPSQFTPYGSVDDATQLAKNLGIDYNVVPIEESYKAIVESMIPAIGGCDFDYTEENIQARIRTVMLMALQNRSGYVLLNSSNKSENALGLCVLYGDTAGAFSVTGDLYKCEMYDLARYINRERDGVIPKQIMDKEPSSELHPNQKDSDTLPPYEVVDAVLYRMLEEGQHREEIVNAGFDSPVVEKIHSMLMQNEKKRYQFPPILRLSSCAFGHERLLPLTNKYGD